MEITFHWNEMGIGSCQDARFFQGLAMRLNYNETKL